MDASIRPAVATTCPYCGVGCGVLARADDDGVVSVSGDPAHPANLGRLCSKGAALGETVSLRDRLLHPHVDGVRTSWDVALDRVAERFRASVDKHGPDSVALYVSGQLLTEDYYVANKLMKGFIGSANIDTNSRLCMASSVAGHHRAFGADTVPGTYEDFEVADLVVLVGSNLAWCHPVLFQRLAAAKAMRPRMKVVVVDPRRTATTVSADLHLALRPDTDVALFSGLLRHLAAVGACDRDYVDAHVNGMEAALSAARRWSVADVAKVTGLSEADVEQFYDWAAKTPRTLTVYSQGVNQSASGVDKVNAIINTHLFTGRIGVPGAGPFSVTGQPNAMGGREVGGLANMLACHMDLGNAAHRALCQAHWNSPIVADRPGLKAVELFDAVHDGQIKALWVMATNPSASMPNASKVDEALRRVDFLAVSDVVMCTDTLRHAHVALPAAAWGEKDGTVTNSERRISRQRAFLPKPGDVRADWAIISDVARRMGFEGFEYAGPHEVFDEFARMSAKNNDGQRDFDIGGLVGLGSDGYQRLAPVQWPVPADRAPQTRFFANGRFFTDDRRARMVATPVAEPARRRPRFPLVLNTGRVRDQWHTMTRTGRSPTLSAHFAEPYVEIHPSDAAECGIAHATIAQVTSPFGQILVRALVTDRQAPGSLFVPIHWTDQSASCARVDQLVAPVTDPVSGQPALKFSRAAVCAFPAQFFAYAISTTNIVRPSAVEYWAHGPLHAGNALELAGAAAPEDPAGFAANILGRDDLLGAVDQAQGTARFAAFDGDTLAAAFFFAPRPVEASRAYLAAQLGTSADRMSVLAGRPAGNKPDPGPVICACFQVGANTILEAARQGAVTVEAVGECLGAGTNCGSCRSEIARLIAPVPETGVKADAEEAAERCAQTV